MADSTPINDRIAQTEQLIRQIDQLADPAARSHVQQLVQTIMQLHGEGLTRIVQIIADADAGGSLMQRLAADELIAPLLLLYDVHPRDVSARIGDALDKVRPYLKSHGGNVELVDIADDGVHLRMQGSCHGCPSSAMTLKLAIEDAVYAAAPDIAGLHVEGVVDDPALAAVGHNSASYGGNDDGQFVPLDKLTVDGSRRQSSNNAEDPADFAGAWRVLEDIESIPPNSLHTVSLGGQAVLICRAGDALYAYDLACVTCGQSLADAHLDGTMLTCHGCGQHYNLALSGRAVDNPALHLDPFPLLIEGHRARIALPTHGAAAS